MWLLFVITVAIIVAALTALRDPVQITDLITAADDAGHGTFNIAATRFELDFIKGHPVTAPTNLFDIATIVEIDVSKAQIVGFVSDRAATCLHGATFGFAIAGAKSIIGVSALARIPNRTVAMSADIEMQCAVSGLNRNAARHLFARLIVMSQGG